MARMHSRDKGKSGSTRPANKIPSWAPYKGKEVEKLILKLEKVGKSTSEIGTILRDNYGIHSVRVLTGKKVTQIFKENKIIKVLVVRDLWSLYERRMLGWKWDEKNR